MAHRQYLKKIDPLVQYPPATYCPANGMLDPEDPDFPANLQGYPQDLGSACTIFGYVKKDDGKYDPPVNFPAPNSDEIILFVSNAGPRCLAFKCQGAYTVRVESIAGALIYTQNKATDTIFSYQLPSGYDYFFVRITPQASNSLTLFTVMYMGSYQTNWPILKAVFNTPNIVTLTSAFASQTYLKACEFISTLNYLTSIANIFQNAGIGYFKFPSSIPILTNMTYAFSGSLIKTIDFNTCSMPLLTNMSYSMNACYNLTELILNPVVPKLTTLNNILTAATALKVANFNFDIEENSVGVNIQYLCSGMNALEELILPNFKLISSTLSANYLCNASVRLKKLTFRGDIPLISIASQAWTGCTLVEEIYFGNILTATTFAFTYTANVLRKVKISDTTHTEPLVPTNYLTIEEVYGTGANAAPQTIKLQSSVLKTLNCPNYKFDYAWIGGVGAPLSSVNLNWANSATSGSGSPTILIAGSLSTTEINRIFTALPVVSGKTINIISNPGYAGCTKSIATAKGWTVY